MGKSGYSGMTKAETRAWKKDIKYKDMLEIEELERSDDDGSAIILSP